MEMKICSEKSNLDKKLTSDLTIYNFFFWKKRRPRPTAALTNKAMPPVIGMPGSLGLPG